jgi:hypothetical protein
MYLVKTLAGVASAFGALPAFVEDGGQGCARLFLGEHALRRVDLDGLHHVPDPKVLTQLCSTGNQIQSVSPSQKPRQLAASETKFRVCR